MAPEGTVPIAIFPPFSEKPRYDTKCVVYSQLTDFEEEEQDYGNVPQYKPQYQPSRHPRQVSSNYLLHNHRSTVAQMAEQAPRDRKVYAESDRDPMKKKSNSANKLNT